MGNNQIISEDLPKGFELIEEPQDKSWLSLLQKAITQIPQKQVEVEQKIRKRPSMVRKLREKGISPLAHPLGALLRPLGATFEVAEGIPASLGLAFQRGEDIAPKTLAGTLIPPLGILEMLSKPAAQEAIGSVLRGERPVQRGDIARAVGIPEPFSATIGLLSGMPRFMPEQVLATGVMKGVGAGTKVAMEKVPYMEEIVNNARKYGKNAVSTIGSMLTRIPRKHFEDLIDNPHWANPQWVAQEERAVNALWNEATPILKTSPIKFDPKPIFESLKQAEIAMDREFIPTRFLQENLRAVGLSTTERETLNTWLTQISNFRTNPPKIQVIRRMLREMDDALSPVYKKIREQGGVTGLDNFQKLTRQLRYAVRRVINPKTAPGLDALYKREAMLDAAKVVKSSFTEGVGRGAVAKVGGFFRALPFVLALKGMGIPAIPAGLAGYTTTLPATWGGRLGLIRDVAMAKGELAKRPYWLAPLIRGGLKREPVTEEELPEGFELER